MVEGQGHADVDETRLSPTEQFYFNLYTKHKQSTALLLYTDVYFNGLSLRFDEVLEILKLAISAQPIAHTGFETIQHGGSTITPSVRRKILSTKQALDYNIVDKLDDEMQSLDKCFGDFDLSKHGPVRFTFATKPFLSIRFIFHRVGFDFRAAQLFVEGFIDIMKIMGKRKTIFDLRCDHTRSAFQALDRYLTSNDSPLKQLWSKQLLKRIRKSTFSTTKRNVKKFNHRIHTAYLSFSSFTSRKILYTTICTKTTLLCLVTSLYQLLLSFYSRNKYVTVTMESDQRRLIADADAQNTVESMTNLIPIVSTIPPKSTPLYSFISGNEGIITECMSMAAFPYIQIEQLANKSSRKQLNRHLVRNRCTETIRQDTIQMTPIKEAGMFQETCLNFYYDHERDILKIQLQALMDVYLLEETTSILQKFARMLRIVGRDERITINEMKDYILKDKHFMILNDIFVKVGDNGNSCKGNLALSDNEETGTSLIWTTENQTPEFIPFKAISNIHIITKEGGKALWIKTARDEEHTFVFTSENRVNIWVKRLEEIVNWGITHV
ncbi:uncharacterized protein LOC126829917 [Patella vulgata]|uniref:uncharacterized protein LOC126829917 n=1 Tax=Patella vulgata TaxID=6465 RepID=UPI00217F6A6A|nr:uncharacterized protein LOC126829917 [Patella vulgata]